jgi:hypothetical protein
MHNGIQNGDNTHNQDHVINPVSFSTINTTSNTVVSPTPDDVLSDAILFKLFVLSNVFYQGCSDRRRFRPHS